LWDCACFQICKLVTFDKTCVEALLATWVQQCVISGEIRTDNGSWNDILRNTTVSKYFLSSSQRFRHTNWTITCEVEQQLRIALFWMQARRWGTCSLILNKMPNVVFKTPRAFVLNVKNCSQSSEHSELSPKLAATVRGIAWQPKFYHSEKLYQTNFNLGMELLDLVFVAKLETTVT